MSDPKGFLKYRRETPERRPPAERVHDWHEFYRPQTEDALKQQGARCMDCGVPFCQGPHGCPVENLIPEWNDMVQSGRWFDALKNLHRTNNFPEFTGKLCPAPCESACVLGITDSPVTIRQIESSIIERGFTEGWVKPVLPVRKSGKHVAVVGSGPAGLAAAQQLVRAGHRVTVYEKAPRPGGLLRYGIPDFKMEKSVLDRRLEQLRAEGVEFVTNTDVGTDVTAADLLKCHDAICLTVGAERARELPIPGRELKGVHLAMDYLVRQNRLLAGDPPLGEAITAQGKRVVILGGGDTGSDCLGTAHRQGATSVSQFELMPRPPESRDASTPWPHWPLQLRTSHAHEEGGDRQWSYQTTSLSGDSKGHVRALHGHRVERLNGKMTKVAGSEFEIETDLVLLALGFAGIRSGLIEGLGVKCSPHGVVLADTQYRTNVGKVFVAGDARRGASLIVWAIAEGRKMAAAVDQFLERKEHGP